MADETVTETVSAFEQFLQPLDASAQMMVLHSLHLLATAKGKAWKTRRLRELIACIERVAA